MGKFIDTRYNDTITKITDFQHSLLNQNFYALNDKGRGTICEYYNINEDKSSLDPGSKLAYTDIGEESPIRFNLIHNMFIYQFNRVNLEFNDEEFGMQASDIDQESYILPNTIHPYEGDFLTIHHSSGTWLYRVNNVNRDTLENGANVWKISYRLDKTTDENILKNIVKEFEYIDVKEGTNIKAVVESTDYKLALEVEHMNDNLRDYFRDLFYSDKVQTFIYKWYTEYRMYDPYAIEFIIRNKLLQSYDDYTHVKHQTKVPITFSIDYNRSIYRAFEEQDKRKLAQSNYTAQANYINDPMSLFATRYEQYFALDYNVINEPNGPLNPRGIIPIMDQDLVQMIMEDKLYENADLRYRNIIIKFFNRKNIVSADLKDIENIDFQPVEQIFYEILFLIYSLDRFEKKLLS